MSRPRRAKRHSTRANKPFPPISANGWSKTLSPVVLMMQISSAPSSASSGKFSLSKSRVMHASRRARSWPLGSNLHDRRIHSRAHDRAGPRARSRHRRTRLHLTSTRHRSRAHRRDRRSRGRRHRRHPVSTLSISLARFVRACRPSVRPSSVRASAVRASHVCARLTCARASPRRVRRVASRRARYPSVTNPRPIPGKSSRPADNDRSRARAGLGNGTPQWVVTRGKPHPHTSSRSFRSGARAGGRVCFCILCIRDGVLSSLYTARWDG